MAGQGRRSNKQTDQYGDPAPRRRIGVWLITGVLVAGAGVGGYAVYRAVSNTINPQQCTATQADGNSVNVDNSQAANAATIAAVAQARQISNPRQAVIIALATARQESKIHNLNYGDRDSIGLFQQRTSMNWGSPEQIADPVYASGRFFKALTALPEWDTMEEGKAAQAVQRSADSSGSSYQQWVPMATVLADALTGTPGASLTCTPSDAKVAVETRGANGLTPRAAAVGTALDHAFGAILTDANSGGPKFTGSADGLTLAIDTKKSDNLQRIYARWAVAQSDALAIDQVAYADQVWTRSSGKWKTSATPVTGVNVTVLKGS